MQKKLFEQKKNSQAFALTVSGIRLARLLVVFPVFFFWLAFLFFLVAFFRLFVFGFFLWSILGWLFFCCVICAFRSLGFVSTGFYLFGLGSSLFLGLFFGGLLLLVLLWLLVLGLFWVKGNQAGYGVAWLCAVADPVVIPFLVDNKGVWLVLWVVVTKNFNKASAWSLVCS